MKKITKLFSTLLLLCVSLAGNAETKVTLGTEYTSVEALSGKAFAIINKTDEKAICNKNAGNDFDLQYLSYADAFSAPGCKFKIEQVTDESDADANGKYLIRCVDKDGGNYSVFGWASPYFQSNKKDDSHCCFFFALALDDTQKRGIDANNTAVWDIQYDSTNKGFTLKNVGTGKYYNDPTKDATSDTPAYFTFCDVKVEEILAPGTETLIYSYDYTEKKAKVPGAWGQNPNGKDSIDAETGAYVIVNNTKTEANYNLQVFIANGFDTKEGYKYRIKITMMANGAGEANLATAPWSSTNMDKSFSFAATDDWTEYNIAYDNAEDQDESGAHILWQSGLFVGEVKIKKVEVYEIAPETPPAPKYWYTILEDDCSFETNFCVKYFKNYTDEATVSNGAVVVKSLEPEKNYNGTYYMANDNGDQVDAVLANDWDTQFLVSLPVTLPKGTKMRFSMRCKADEAATAGTQSHRQAPAAGAIEGQDGYAGTYLLYQLMGDVAFTDNWQTFYKEFSVTSNEANENMGSICFNLSGLQKSINYYFDDIIVAAELTEEAAAKIAGAKPLNIPLTVTSAGYATFVPAMDVVIPEEGVKAYTAKLSDNKQYVTLTEITGKIKAGTPVIIEGSTQDLEVTTDAAAASNNDLKVSDGTVKGDGKSIYVLANGNDGVGFYKLAKDASVPKGKAYLQVAAVESREFIAIAGEATGIKTVENQKKSGIIYNLAGQQVKKAQKGVYIINGKKIAVK